MHAQKAVLNDEFAQVIDKYLSESIDQLSVDELETAFDKYVLLDTREIIEYQTSHIPGAKYLGYDDPDFSVLNNIDKDTPVLLYCSIGYRSEKMGETLQSKGFTNVYNLYGSIFEWANQGNTLVNTVGDTIKAVHTYNKNWGKWMQNPAIEKVD